MIQLVKRNQLDVKKYNQCILNSLQNRVYAFAWYLDTMAKNWDVLVLNDYDAVMPLPWKRKYGILYITQPFFTQQLGIFSKGNISGKIVGEFLKKIPKKFLKINLQFNSENQIFNDKCVLKDNYLLPLNISYDKLFKQFSKGRKHAIHQGEKENLLIEGIDFKSLLNLSNNHYSFEEISGKEYQKLSELVAALHQKKMVKVLGVKQEDTLLGGAVFVFNSNRITYLFSAVSEKGKELQVASLLLNSIIKEFSETNYILDFEGSMIKSIASFFKSFGAERETYFLFKKTVL